MATRWPKTRRSSATMSNTGLQTLAAVSLEEFFEFYLTGLAGRKSRNTFQVGEQEYSIKLKSLRYQCFTNSLDCYLCGLKGTHFLLQKMPNSVSAHFNLFGFYNEELVLFTKDHLVPRSKGGPDSITNLATCCYRCNQSKADNLPD